MRGFAKCRSRFLPAVLILIGLGLFVARTLPRRFFLEAWDERNSARNSHNRQSSDELQLVVVACGKRFEEALINIKSSLLFSKSKIFYHIFAEKDLHSRFDRRIQAWPLWYRKDFSYKLYNISYPDDGYTQNWKMLFKPCASLRIFLPMLLDSAIDSVVFVDADTIFLGDAKGIWSYFDRFNSTQLCSFSMEYINHDIGWYNRFALHPYYGSTGINTGVILMNLTRMRKAMFKNDLVPRKLRWSEMLLPLYKKYRYDLSWGEQDLLNIIFHHNPEMLHILPCRWNFRTNHCMYGLTCLETRGYGVKILHGKTEVFLNGNVPAFKAVFDTIKEYQFQQNHTRYIVKPLEEALLRSSHTPCGKEREVMLKGARDLAKTQVDVS